MLEIVLEDVVHELALVHGIHAAFIRLRLRVVAVLVLEQILYAVRLAECVVLSIQLLKAQDIIHGHAPALLHEIEARIKLDVLQPAEVAQESGPGPELLVLGIELIQAVHAVERVPHACERRPLDGRPAPGIEEMLLRAARAFSLGQGEVYAHAGGFGDVDEEYFRLFLA